MRTQPKPHYPKVLVLKDKHSTDLFLVKNQKQKDEACVKIVKQWLESQYIYEDETLPKTLNEYLLKKTGLTEEELNELSTNPKVSKLKVVLGYGQGASISEEIKKLIKEYNQSKEINAIYKKAKEAVKDKNGALAWQVIRYHRDHEYMGVEEQLFSNIKY